MIKKIHLFWIVPLFLSACIGDDIITDFVEPSIRITNPLDSLAAGESHTFEAIYFNNIGREETVDFVWKSSDENTVTIDSDGLATGINFGMATIMVSAMQGEEIVATTDFELMVGETTVNSGGGGAGGQIKTTSSYKLQGTFTITENGGETILEFAEDYEASTALPGLYVYLSNNPGTTSGAMEIGEVKVFKGAHSYRIAATNVATSYSHVLYFCKPFNVKVGDGKIEQ